MYADFYRVTALLLGVGLLISVGEHFFNWKRFKRGPLSWRVLATGRHLTGLPLVDRALGFAMGYPAFLGVLALHGVAVLAMVAFAVTGTVDLRIQALVVLTLLVMHFRNWYSLEGADQMMAIVAVTLLAYSAVPESPLVAGAGLWFLALQTTLSYFSAGLGKLLSSDWRGGQSLLGVLNTQTYGNESLAVVVRRRPQLARWLSWSILGFQCLFPLILILGPPLAFLFVAGGILFHVMNVLVMGLHRFFWAFMASYPAIIFCVWQTDTLF